MAAARSTAPDRHSRQNAGRRGRAAVTAAAADGLCKDTVGVRALGVQFARVVDHNTTAVTTSTALAAQRHEDAIGIGAVAASPADGLGLDGAGHIAAGHDQAGISGSHYAAVAPDRAGTADRGAAASAARAALGEHAAAGTGRTAAPADRLGQNTARKVAISIDLPRVVGRY